LLPRSYTSVKPAFLAYLRDTSSIWKEGFFNNIGADGKHYNLFLSVGDETVNPYIHLIIQGAGLNLHTGDQVYIQSINKSGFVTGVYYINDFGSVFSPPIVTSETKVFKSNQSSIGILSVVKRDSVNRILSCTFSFDAVDTLGNIVQIRNGRFDIRTQ